MPSTYRVYYNQSKQPQNLWFLKCSCSCYWYPIRIRISLDV